MKLASKSRQCCLEVCASFNSARQTLSLLSLDAACDGSVRPLDVRECLSVLPERLWYRQFPKLGFDEILHVIKRANRKRKALDPWANENSLYVEEMPTCDERRLLCTADAYEQLIGCYGRERFRRIAGFGRLSAHHFLLAFLLDTVPKLEHLLRSVPGLVWMVVAAALRKTDREDDAIHFLDKLLCFSQQDIAAALALPPPRILRKVPPSDVSERLLQRFTHVYHSDARVRTLSHHVHDLHAPLLRLLAHPIRRYLDNRFLMELTSEPDNGSVTARELIKCFKLLRRFNKPLPMIQHAGHAHRLLQTITNCLPLGNLEEFLAARYPCPPLPSTPHVRGLDSPYALLDECISQRGLCAAQMFHESVLARRSYFYQVLPSPGISRRATMQLVNTGEDPLWRIETIVLRSNRQPPSELVESLAAWVAERQGMADLRSVAPGYRLSIQTRLF